MNTILVPIDFSKHSEYALKVAAQYAKEYDAEIVVLHMLGLSDSIFTKEPSVEVAQAVFHIKLAQKQFGSFLDKAYLKGIKVRETVQNYTVFEHLNDFALAEHCDLIIMGSHGAKGIKEEFVGSNTERVVRTSSVPVLVIKKDGMTALPRKILLACDFKTEHIKSYREALLFFEKLGVQIELVYINLPSDRFRSTLEIEKRMDHFMNSIAMSAFTINIRRVIVNGYAIESGLYEYAAKAGAEALAIPTHGRRGLSHFFNGSIAEGIANHAQLPVFTFKI